MVIYALKDPRTDEIRYIGKTTRTVELRLVGHLSKHELQRHSHRSNWLRELISLGMKPNVEVIMKCQSDDELNAAEIFCIKFCRDIGLPMTNGTDGGEGTRGPMSELTKSRIRAAELGKIIDAETRAKMSISHLGTTMSGDIRAKISIANKGRVISPESRKNMSDSWIRRRSGLHIIKCSDGRTFGSQQEAASTLGCNRSMIRKALKGLTKAPGGLLLSYLTPNP